MKSIITIIVLTIALSGCATIQKYAKQGMGAAEKAASKYVDKQAGTGTYDDSMKMKNDNDKTEHLLPYYISVNKLYDEKKIDEKKRDELKAQFDKNYDEWKDGKTTQAEYDKKCTECIEKAQK